MFSVQQKRDISDAVQKILHATNHPELPTTGEIGFNLHVEGAEDWSYADIRNNGAVGDPGLNPHNELMASMPEEEGRGLIEKTHRLIDDTQEEAAGMPTPTLTPLTDLQQRVTAELNQLKDRLIRLETAPDVSFEPIDLRFDQIESVAEDLAKDAGQLRLLVDDLNNAIGSIQDQVNDVADVVKKIKEGTDGKAGSE